MSSEQSVPSEVLQKILQISPEQFTLMVKKGIVLVKSGSSPKEYLLVSSIVSYIKYLNDKEAVQPVEADELMKILCLSDTRSIPALVRKGIVVRVEGSRNFFDANKSCQNFLKSVKESESDDDTSAQIIREANIRSAVAKAEREEEEHRKVKRLNDIEEAQVIPVELLLEFFGPLSGQINRSLEGLIVEFRRELGEQFNSDLAKKVSDQIDMCKASYAKAHIDLVNEIDRIQTNIEDVRSGNATNHEIGKTKAE
jgi:hypothetical protein